MELIYQRYGLEIVDHFAQDGLAPLLFAKGRPMDENQFKYGAITIIVCAVNSRFLVQVTMLS